MSVLPTNTLYAMLIEGGLPTSVTTMFVTAYDGRPSDFVTALAKVAWNSADCAVARLTPAMTCDVKMIENAGDGFGDGRAVGCVDGCPDGCEGCDVGWRVGWRVG